MIKELRVPQGGLNRWLQHPLSWAIVLPGVAHPKARRVDGVVRRADAQVSVTDGALQPPLTGTRLAGAASINAGARKRPLNPPLRQRHQ